MHIFNAANLEVETATATPSGGAFSTSNESELESGSYTAYASQASSLGNAAGKSEPRVSFTISTASPTVTLTGPTTPSKNTKPTFSGKASDPTEPVVVHIFNAANAEVTATATPSGGTFSTSNESALADGAYTAYASQASSLGNPAGKSKPRVSFTINTAPPSVTLTGPATPSKNTKPTFSGTASDSTGVTVHIFNAANAEVTATATPSGGAFSTSNESELESGSYTAYASQASSLGNAEGKSEPRVSFTVNTHPPTVTLNQPTKLSNNTTPFFTGFASDKTTVTVRIYVGSKAEGKPFSEATAEGNGGEWTSGNASPALPSGQYTAQATQPSSLGNAAGISEAVSFTVETGPPHVTLKQPTTPSNHTTPSFTGTASDHTTVVIDVYAGTSAEGGIVSEAAATGNGGTWNSGPANKVLTTGVYTAVATQQSSLLGNPTGISNSVTFEVNTSSPTVSLKEVLPPLSNNVHPSFSGTASDTTKVVVHIFNALHIEKAKATATPSGGHWSTSNEEALPSETYTAVATQESSIENPQGESNEVTFTINTNPPTVTLNPESVQLRSNNTTPAFNGTASDTKPVVVHIYEGTKPEGTEVTSTTATGTGSVWNAPAVTLATGAHTYTAIATQASSLNNPTGKSNAVTFTVDTSSPSVILTQPPSPSNNTAPTFTGEAGGTNAVPEVTINIKNEAGTTVSTATATVTGGKWVSHPATPALSDRHPYLHGDRRRAQRNRRQPSG